MQDIAIFGAGGFGREVLTLIKSINSIEPTYNIVGFFDDGLPKGHAVNGYEVLGGTDELNKWKEKLNVVISIGSPKIKKLIINNIASNKNLSFPILIHPNVILGDTEYIKIGCGSVICAGCILTTNIKVEDFVILNLGCTVGHDTVIGEYSSFMPSVNISGEVNIGNEVYVGTGAKIINQLNIGEKTTIGAGAVVVRDLPDRCTAVGVPAKVIKVTL